jgi:serine/threonine protein kinase/tetratricopeptide (TPR) repeat protein
MDDRLNPKDTSPVTRRDPTPMGGSVFRPSLAAGRRLAGRFRIVRFLARGGMGEVYEAEDLELGEHVALKTIRQDIAWAEQPLERFKREIHLARKVTHPNVCRIFDVFHHVESSGEKTTFLSMELLSGETLFERVRRIAPMNPNEAWPIVRQMVEALAAAHKAGVIHRDFKSSNVMLVPSGSPEQGVRVVVTDFGLARSTFTGESRLSALSEKGQFRGTPAYMAPEQLEGGEITAAADIYAVGLVMYEMLTGNLPFSGESEIVIALKRLREASPSPRIQVPDLDENWEACVLRCLERNPKDRFSNVEDLLKALQGDPIDVPAASSPARQTVTHPRRRRLFAAAGAVLLCGILLGAVLFQNLPHPRESAARRSVAVLGFKNLTGDADAAWLSTALAEVLTTELAAGEQLRAIPGENVSRMKVEFEVPDSSSFAPDTLTRIRSYLGADVVVFGSYLVLNGIPSKVRVDLRLQDSVSGDLLATISDEGYPTELLELVSRIGSRLREKLGVRKLDVSEAKLVDAALPANPQAARAYSEALEKLRLFDALGARSLLEKSVEADPAHALARAALATSWSMLGYATRAKEEAKKAVDLSARLSREDQLLIEGRYRESALEWNQAAEVYRTLFGFFPDNLDYGIRLASAQTSAGKARDAITTVEMLRKLSGLDNNSPRIDLVEARAAGALSDFKREQLLASSAVTKGKAQGARLLVAGARLIEGTAFANLGNPDQARAAFLDARNMYVAAGDRWDAANSATNLGYVLTLSGDLAGAKEIYEESLTTYKELGDKKGTAAALTSMANLSRSQANLKNAQSMHEQALAIYREIDDRAGQATALNNIANIFGLKGDSGAAQRMYETALPVFREIGDRNGAATVVGNLADLLAEKGDFAGAAALYQESLATFRDVGNNSSVASTLSRLADVLMTQGDLEGARKQQAEALDLRIHLGEKGSIAESQLALAHILLQQGSPGSAETSARAAAEQFQAENRTDDEASAFAVLARSLLAQNRSSDAAAAIDRAEELSGKSPNPSVRLAVAITTSSIRATAGGTAKAINDLDAIVIQAHQAGLITLEFEARLALGEIEGASGRGDAGRARLTALEKEASRKGYKYLADRAAAARGRIPVPGTPGRLRKNV